MATGKQSGKGVGKPGPGKGHGEGSKATRFGSVEREEKAKESKELSSRIDDDLVVINHVISTQPSADETHQQKWFRKWMNRHYDRAMVRKAELEKAREEREKPAGVSGETRDVGTEKALEVVERWLVQKQAEREGKG